MGVLAKIIRGVVTAAVLASATVGMPVAAGDKVTIGQPAPDFTLTLVDGTKVTRDQLRGQVVILNFWATWCVPCRAELPTLDAYYVQRKDVGLRVFAVTTEDSLQPYQLKKPFRSCTSHRSGRSRGRMIRSAMPCRPTSSSAATGVSVMPKQRHSISTV
jgi:thiol-disulfide isomerase/thioredoxin